MVVVVIVAILIIVSVVVAGSRYSELEKEVFKELGISSWKIYPEIDACVTVKSRQALENYDDIKFFKEHKEKLIEAENIILRKTEMSEKLKAFIENNEYRERTLYNRIETNIDNILKEEIAYRIRVSYISSAGNNLGQKEILVDKDDIDELKNNPSLLMGKGEYNKYLKEQQKEA